MHETRVAFADTNWLFSTYYNTRDHAAVQRWRKMEQPHTLVVSEAVLAECRCNFRRVGDRLGALESDVRARLFVDCGYTFAQMTALADELFRKYAPRCNVGTLDLLHIAAAKRFGCRWFLSFDSNSGCRAIAHSENLKVFPELNAVDRRWIAKFK
ncbi:MAG TPA: PIN domain-containing protein [Verrucomicrobiae bacterium]|jgi:predicted nucleic acid-binding protein